MNNPSVISPVETDLIGSDLLPDVVELFLTDAEFFALFFGVKI